MKDLLVFFASDLHGSDVCFRKFLNAGKVYKPSHLILGADLSGKVIVPIYRDRNAWHARYRETDMTFETESEVEALEKQIRAAGAYPLRTSRDEISAIEGDEESEKDLFRSTQVKELERWVELADERLREIGIPCFAMPGNDDSPAVGEILSQSERVTNVDERVCQIEDDLYMVSLGFSTPTPWHTPREISEDEYQKRLEALFDDVPEGATVILNAHDPPHATGVDEAPLLDEELRLTYDSGGEVAMANVGSKAVRRVVETHQPMLALHGHIHEGRGKYELGRTIGFNPGSIYQEGVLQGVLLRFSQKGIADFVFTSG